MMSGSGSHVALLALLTSAAGIAMTQLGVAKRQLSARAVRRRCSSCGRRLTFRGCEHCGF